MQTKALAEFAAGLKFEDIPEDVRANARKCNQDAVGIAVFGAKLPWSKIVIDYARRNGAGGSCSILGVRGAKASAPMAALANGALVHAFEMDSLRTPGTGEPVAQKRGGWEDSNCCRESGSGPVIG